MLIIPDFKLPGGQGLERTCYIVNVIALLILVPFQIFAKLIMFYFKTSSFFIMCILMRRLLQDPV